MVKSTFEYIKEQITTLDIFKVLDDEPSNIVKITKKFEGCSKVIVIGTGGSSLGGKCLVNFHSLYTGEEPKVIFLENVDSRHFLNVITNNSSADTGVIVISKSGRTTETLSLFLTLCEKWKYLDYDRCLVITETSNKNNDLRSFAEFKEIEIIEHNPNIGGRFSVFSVVGLLPAVLNGVDIEAFIRGAKYVTADVMKSWSFEDCRLFNDIVSIYRAFKKGNISQHVLMSYSDLMEDYGKWFVQLVSESLGKKASFGITPVRAIGTVDQHSMLQLFLGGPSDKLFTVITQKDNVKTTPISCDLDAETIKQLKTHSVHDLMIAHQKATIDVLKAKASVRVLEFETLTIETIGFLMALSIIEVLTIAKLEGINPFDQPAVEKSKKLAMKYLRDM